MTIPEATEEFRTATSAKGDFRADSAEDHALHDRMAQAFYFFIGHGPAGRDAFTELLQDESPYVRLWVAAQLLSENDARAIPVAEELASQRGLLGFSAQVTLDEYRAGRLRSPFATNR